MKIALRALSLALLICFAFVSAQATILNPGTSDQLPDTGFGPTGMDAFCSGTCTQLAFTSGTMTATNGVFVATLSAAVYTDSDNTFCAGCLDFVYQVSNGATAPGKTPPDGVGRVTAIDFTGWQTDVGYTLTAPPAGTEAGCGSCSFVDGTVAPGLVDRNTDSTVGFQFESTPFSAAIAPGETSNVLVIETDATVFGAGAAAALDGGTANFAAFDPAPEPTTVLLMGLGMLALAGVGRFRRNRS
jgi:hypothetical protein